MKSDRVYLDHILECISWIGRFTAEGIKLDHIWEIIKGDLSLLRAELLATIED
jgi:uncharacterized protein with HEPN domain